MLTDVQCRSASCPADRKQARFADSGGLYLPVSPNGSKRWFYKYRIQNKEKQFALGSYPTGSLTAARKARDIAKLKKSEGVDPIQARKMEKLKGLAVDGSVFKVVALEWHAKQVGTWSASHAEPQNASLNEIYFYGSVIDTWKALSQLSSGPF